MKRKLLIEFTVLALLTLYLTSCGTKDYTAYSSAQIAEAVILNQSDISDLQSLTPDDGYYNEYLSNIYKIQPDRITDGAIYYFNGMSADEIAVFLVSDESNQQEITDALSEYKEARTGAFAGYAPEQSAILENGIVVSRGKYVALLICKEPEKAEETFADCFSDNPPKLNTSTESGEEANANQPEAGTSTPSISAQPTGTVDDATTPAPSISVPPTGTADDTISPAPSISASPTGTADAAISPAPSISVPPTETPDDAITPTPRISEPPAETANVPVVSEDIFDSGAVLAAWRSGAYDALSGKNRSVLNACIDIIDTNIDTDMDDYEKELAIHDWIVNWASYDKEVQNNSPDAKPEPDNFNPYGVIFHKKAICSGYTSTFQLFMDMLGIECISVDGISTRTGGVHAWNMIRLYDEWYCVDVTWDDPSGETPSAESKHKYFNVTSEFLIQTGHKWEETLVPVADSGKLYRN
ncbi:MAG: DUF4358 domain-containing protein [Oscillospiraceae bacterium]|nr:DUF4358 domain-containing protein [Oscillospiraceae bacterium]